jgi:signal transduction histidine kinase
VRDTGVGVAAEDLDRIFERFARGRGAVARYRGAGLGLAIVASIADGHGGQVLVADEPGGGVRFTIVVPGRR